MRTVILCALVWLAGCAPPASDPVPPRSWQPWREDPAPVPSYSFVGDYNTGFGYGRGTHEVPDVVIGSAAPAGLRTSDEPLTFSFEADPDAGLYTVHRAELAITTGGPEQAKCLDCAEPLQWPTPELAEGEHWTWLGSPVFCPCCEAPMWHATTTKGPAAWRWDRFRREWRRVR